MGESNATSHATKPQPGLHTLVVNLMLAMFISVCVFAIASYFVLVPHMAVQKLQIEQMSQRIHELDARATSAAKAGLAYEGHAAVPQADSADSALADHVPEDTRELAAEAQ